MSSEDRNGRSTPDLSLGDRNAWLKMDANGHLEKARAVKGTLETVLQSSTDVERDAPAIVELIYGIAFHLIAYGMELKYGQHRDTHVGLPKFLRQLNEDRIADLFDDLNRYRAGRWYGGRWNGQVVDDSRRILGEIEKWAKG